MQKARDRLLPFLRFPALTDLLIVKPEVAVVKDHVSQRKSSTQETTSARWEEKAQTDNIVYSSPVAVADFALPLELPTEYRRV